MRVTWWGHATVTVELGGLRVLTDPALTPRLAHLHRVGSPAPPPGAAVADAVLVSHLHADHLHLPSLRRIGPAHLLVPAGAAPLVRRAGHADPDEAQPGTSVALAASLAAHAVPARHDGRRLPGSRLRGPALGWVLEAAGRRIWFAGDTGLFDGIADIGPVDLALVPVGGWGPTLGPGHLDPEQAAEAAHRVGARVAVPIHWGTFWPVGLRPVAPGTFRRMFVEPGARFAAAAHARGVEARVLRPGEVVTLDG